MSWEHPPPDVRLMDAIDEAFLDAGRCPHCGTPLAEDDEHDCDGDPR